MAHEILSVKLYELDEKLRKIRGRILRSEAADPEELKREIAALQKECRENEQELFMEMRFSRASTPRMFSETYMKIRDIVSQAEKTLENEDKTPGAGGPEQVEKAILTAEYALDFAMEASNHALLLSLQAISAQMEQQEIRRKENERS